MYIVFSRAVIVQSYVNNGIYDVLPLYGCLNRVVSDKKKTKRSFSTKTDGGMFYCLTVLSQEIAAVALYGHTLGGYN